MKSTQTKGLRRNTIDKYYTNTTVVQQCIQYVKTHIQIDPTNDFIIEPSAGNGAFITGIKSLSNQYVFYDIEPEHPEIVQQDYLTWEHTSVATTHNRNIHVIGNPPFGRQSSMAIRFIKKSALFSKSISFILPKSFKKDSLQKSFPPYFHLVFEIDLPDKAFLVDGDEYTVPCIFQIWEKRETYREIRQPQTPRHFQFVEKNDHPDISVRRVGINAGRIDTVIDTKSEQSHYFIRFTNGKSTEENITELSQIVYEQNNTVGPRSISKQELMVRFNPVLDHLSESSTT